MYEMFLTKKSMMYHDDIYVYAYIEYIDLDLHSNFDSTALNGGMCTKPLWPSGIDKPNYTSFHVYEWIDIAVILELINVVHMENGKLRDIFIATIIIERVDLHIKIMYT